MAKRGKSRRRSNGFKLPLAIMAPVGFVAADTIDQVRRVGLSSGMNKLTAELTGYEVNSGQFRWDMAKKGAVPILLGAMVHKVAGRTGVNRALASAGVPWIRI